jgi:hypothetical protein
VQDRTLHAHDFGVKVLRYSNELQRALTLPFPGDAESLRNLGAVPQHVLSCRLRLCNRPGT